MKDDNFYSEETIKEMVQDLLSVELLYRVEDKVHYPDEKQYIAMIVKTFSVLVIYEICDSLKKKNLIDLPSDFVKQLRAERNRIKEDITISKNANNTIKEMGIDFKQKVYDIVIYIWKGNLVDINFELYFEKLDNSEFWGQLRICVSQILKTFSKKFFNDENLFESLLNEAMKEYENPFRNDNLEKFSYSTNKLFELTDCMENKDKQFVLYRYRFIDSIYNIEKILPVIEFKIDNKSTFNTEMCLLKWKAMVIESIGKMFRESKTCFMKKVANELSQNITWKEFYQKNRALRNNLHYNETHALSQCDIDKIKANQSVYFDIIITQIKNEIFVDIDKECIDVTLFYKYWIGKGKSFEELVKYEHLYWYTYKMIKPLIKCGKISIKEH